MARKKKVSQDAVEPEPKRQRVRLVRPQAYSEVVGSDGTHLKFYRDGSTSIYQPSYMLGERDITVDEVREALWLLDASEKVS